MFMWRAVGYFIMRCVIRQLVNVMANGVTFTGTPQPDGTLQWKGNLNAMGSDRNYNYGGYHHSYGASTALDFTEAAPAPTGNEDLMAESFEFEDSDEVLLDLPELIR